MIQENALKQMKNVFKEVFIFLIIYAIIIVLLILKLKIMIIFVNVLIISFIVIILILVLEKKMIAFLKVIHLKIIKQKNVMKEKKIVF